MKAASATTPLLLALIRAAGLPEPVCEVRFAPPRRWRFDLCWPDVKVACEVEGAVWQQGRHTRGAGFIGDITKYNEAAIRGWLLVRVTYDMIASGEALGYILRALEARRIT